MDVQIGDIISRPQRRNAKCHCAKVVDEVKTLNPLESYYLVNFWDKGGRDFTGVVREAGFTDRFGDRIIKKMEAVKHSQEAFDSYPDE